MPAFSPFEHPYPHAEQYATSVAYFSMELAIAQPLKTYAGGLGFLAGSHLRSAYALRQNLIGVSILWKYGYYDQGRNLDQTMSVQFMEKQYGFLEKTDLRFQIQVNHSAVWVTAYYLPPEVFGTAPVFFLSTDLPENDYLAQTISHRLYDSNPETRIAASILLGIGGAKLLDLLGHYPDVYHLNECHALPAAFYLYRKFGTVADVSRRLVFTTHTAEEAGNQKTDIRVLDRMGFFDHLPLADVRTLVGQEETLFNHTQATLRLARQTNAVSALHQKVSQQLWHAHSEHRAIQFITNAQKQDYWADPKLYEALHDGDDEALIARKKLHKRRLFERVADQTGEIYRDDVLTLVWARRLAGYKRSGLLLQDLARLERLLTNQQYPIQLIWAGKPYPYDYAAIAEFDRLVHLAKKHVNCSVLVGYELELSRVLKRGADVWLNTPRVRHEASGTSGMSAAMNAAVNLSTADGWIPEFVRHGENGFCLPAAPPALPPHEQDALDARHLLDLLEGVVLPMYYDRPADWLRIVKQSLTDIVPRFDSDRLAREYYELLYQSGPPRT